MCIHCHSTTVHHIDNSSEHWYDSSAAVCTSLQEVFSSTSAANGQLQHSTQGSCVLFSTITIQLKLSLKTKDILEKSADGANLGKSAPKIVIPVLVPMFKILPSGYLTYIPHPSPSSRLHHKTFFIPFTKTNPFKYSFFVDIIPLWNSPPSNFVSCSSLPNFKHHISLLSFNSLLFCT